MPRNKKSALIILLFLFFLNLLTWLGVYDLSRPRFLEVVFFDVGQGDSIFIETPDKKQILIDGGPDSTILEKLAEEMPFYDRSLDLIILTHPEQDHLFGLLEVLKRYKVENIIWTGIVRETLGWKEWQGLIEKEKAQVKIARSGQKIILQGAESCDNIKEPCISLYVLNPFENLSGQEFKDSNDTSIVARLVFNQAAFLFTGDITKLTEKELVGQDAEIDAEVLKTAHHGSKTSSSGEFLERVSPQIAVISAGKNSYGHPHPEVLANLEKFGIEVLRTDEEGDIKIISDGNLLKVVTQRNVKAQMSNVKSMSNN